MQVSARVWRHFDVWLLAAVAALTISSVAMIQSAVAGNESLAEAVPRQMIYALIGLVVIVVAAAIDYRFWSAIARPIYAVVLVLLALIMAAGFVGFGAARWFNVGIVNIQPSELSKVLMIIVLADYLARHQHEIAQFRIFIRSLILTAVPAVLVFLQPDLSTAIVLGVIWLSLVFASGAKLRYFLVLLAIATVLLLLLSPLLLGYFSGGYQAGEDFYFIQRYQMQRIVSFLLPDPEAHHGESYNVNQAKIAIGSGGWFGQGYGHGTQTQLRFMKVRHTDFIFSALSEEFGFVGAVVVLIVLGFIIAALPARSPHGTRSIRRAHLLRRGDPAALPVGGQHRHEPGAHPGLRPAAAVLLVRRLVPAGEPAGHRHGGERHLAPQADRAVASATEIPGMPSSPPARARFAPSPTGRFHIGGARTALYDYLLARQTGGQFILRIEDTDQKRFDPNAERELIDSLRWLGIEWDEGPDIGGPCAPYRQSERKAIYQRHADDLVKRGHAYACFCSADRLAHMRQEQQKRKQPSRYDGTCR